MSERRQKAETPKPAPGDRVRVHEHYPNERSYDGEVIDALSRQFTFLPDHSPHIRFCMYAGNWEHI